MADKDKTKMTSFSLEPRYSSSQIPGKCIKCLGEQELGSCLVELLREENDDDLPLVQASSTAALGKETAAGWMRQAAELMT